MNQDRILRKTRRVRRKIIGTKEMPRLSVFRSNKFIYAQIIDDSLAKTLLGVSQKHLKDVSGNKIDMAKAVGVLIAKEAAAKKISKVVFDRGAYIYKGRVKALAEGAREGGLIF